MPKMPIIADVVNIDFCRENMNPTNSEARKKKCFSISRFFLGDFQTVVKHDILYNYVIQNHFG